MLSGGGDGSQHFKQHPLKNYILQLGMRDLHS